MDSGSPAQSKGGIDTESIEGRRAEEHGGLVVPSQFNTRSLLSYRDQVWLLQQSVEKVVIRFKMSQFVSTYTDLYRSNLCSNIFELSLIR